MGLVLMLPGIKWLVILTILGSVSPAAVTAFGLAQTVYGLALALASGLTIATVGALVSRRAAHDLVDWQGAGHVAREELRDDLRRTVRRLPRAVAPSLDVIPLMTTFAVATAVASTVSEEVGATTATVIALLRTVIVPLKAFGVVAGRLTRVCSPSPAAEVRESARIVGVLLCLSVTTGVAVVLLREPVAVALGLPLNPGSAVVAVAGAQLVLEAVTGVGNTMLKVLVAPTALLAEITVVMWGLAVPALVVVAATGPSAGLVWGVLLGARCVFAVLVVGAWWCWSRASRPGTA